MGRRVGLIVLDAHAWLWWLVASRKLSRRAKTEIDRADRLGICTITCFEVAWLAIVGRIALDRPIEEWLGRALAEDRVETLELSAEAAVEAALLDPRRFAGDPIDRIVYATARLEGARLVTRDARIRRFDRETTIW